MKEIPLADGVMALVDDEDFERVAAYKWHQDPNRTTTYAKTRQIPGRGKTAMHRFILNAPSGMQVDHINGNGLDNRRSNLRLCTAHENRRNLVNRRIGASGYRGVALTQNGYRPSVSVNGNKVSLGTFRDPVQAARVRDEAARQVYGEFAILNFPDNDNPSADSY